MEHRCGTRHAADIRVYLRNGTLSAAGRLRQFSLTGGLIRSTLPANELSHIVVQFPGASPVARLEGHIVRRDNDLIAVEWNAFASELVHRLAENHGPSGGYRTFLADWT